MLEQHLLPQAEVRLDLLCEKTEIPKGSRVASGLQHWKCLTAFTKDGLVWQCEFCASTATKIKMMSIKVSGAALFQTCWSLRNAVKSWAWKGVTW